ncbi:MAG: OmpA family protein [Actinomycetota bacterium]|nr:OmpA family protein [Actinomycetota bacterium]
MSRSPGERGWRALAPLVALAVIGSGHGVNRADNPSPPSPSSLHAPVLDLTAPVLALTLDTSSLNGALNNSETGNQRTVTLAADVLFAFNQATLTSAAQGVLPQVAASIRTGATGPVGVVGYTDSIGDPAYNQTLSENRAAAVVAALQPLLAGAPVMLQPSGRGAADPVAPNQNPDGSDNPAGRAQNRRVTISYTVQPQPSPPAP